MEFDKGKIRLPSGIGGCSVVVGRPWVLGWTTVLCYRSFSLEQLTTHKLVSPTRESKSASNMEGRFML